jgi:para-nitrobenzyl esterase
VAACPIAAHASLSPDEERLASAMVSYWTRFARTGDPDSSSTPEWPRYDLDTDLSQSLEPPTPSSGSGFALDHKCAFWELHA